MWEIWNKTHFFDEFEWSISLAIVREVNRWIESKDGGYPFVATNPPIICALKQPRALSGSPRVRMNALLHSMELETDIIISDSSPKCRRVTASGDVITRLAALFESRSCGKEREILEEMNLGYPQFIHINIYIYVYTYGINIVNICPYVCM